MHEKLNFNKNEKLVNVDSISTFYVPEQATLTKQMHFRGYSNNVDPLSDKEICIF